MNSALVYDTFIASIRSVGTACTLAGVGIYLHRRNFVIGDGKRTLALISQQVTIPLLFFTKIIYCNQDWSTDACPDITQSLKDVWSLVLWPLFVVGVGLWVGWLAARLSRTPPDQVRAVLVACAFGNATGLPITLLTVVSTNFPSNTDLGRIDPTLFLSIYLLLYPVLQWGIGGWLLAPEEEGHHSNQRTTTARTDTTTNAVTPLAATATTFYNTIMDRHHHHPSNVVSVKTSESYNKLHRGMAETDASLYISVPDGLYRLGTSASTDNIMSRSDNNTNNNNNDEEEHFLLDETGRESSTPSYSEEYTTPISVDTMKSSGRTPLALSSSLSVSSRDNPPTVQMDTKNEQRAPSADMYCSILQSIFSRCLQPPVIGALAGIIVASQPWLRGIFVDLVDRKGHAPLQFLFDGLYEVGQSAVPMNMIILGCNLSASYNNSRMVDDGDTRKTMLFSRSTSMAIVAGKMIIMPIIGFVSVYVAKTYYWDARIPDDIDGGVYLVAMIVFLTPTANNVMVMVELSGSGSKQAMARIIAWQYALAPIVLSITMTVAVSMAVGLS